ncbi:GH1 family beta-glucosidase [Leptospira sp. GIMC2001]|uniref:GH1 family beta-glucosidase n=1 Tax=Leptospira sp. GIMC2001 TaxID=1513297 RepID=UPI00234BFC38|nr:GH1 family beta-glucosidase [Leptospira sp. GIMC2001]WCL49325.1 GH1 family beta-glucosidase [Leptospira sp. GIMC2001]
MNELKFPKNFTWGTATSAYQIEGGWNVDGKGLSIWDDFVRRKGKIDNGDNGDLGCNHYNLYSKDIDLMSDLGYPNYRFSISWPRVVPNGDGSVNPKGLEFYDRLVDKLLTKKINPFVTLYHWDLPSKLQESGGWMNRATAERFADYSEIVINKLGDRVKNWITINEPWIIYVTGYILGVHPPGFIRPYSSLKVVHNLLLAHGLALERIRSNFPKSKVGITNALSPVQYFKWNCGEKTVARAHAIQNSMWMDPIFKGRYPSVIEEEIYSQNRRNIHPGDLQIISKPTDFLGVNHYTRSIVRAAPIPLFRFIPVKPKYKDAEFTSMDWEIYPKGIKDLLDWIRKEYGNPTIFITENGVAFKESPSSDGIVHDHNRIAYLKEYLTNIYHSIQEGSDVRGYFVWSFMDNFEWQAGYEKTFGLVHIDRDDPNFKRTPKKSADWYSNVIRKNGFQYIE